MKLLNLNTQVIEDVKSLAVPTIVGYKMEAINSCEGDRDGNGASCDTTEYEVPIIEMIEVYPPFDSEALLACSYEVVDE